MIYSRVYRQILYNRVFLPITFVLAATAVSFVFKFYIDQTLAMVYVVAVMFSAWTGGMWGGLFSALLSVFTIDYLFLPPRFALGPMSYEDGAVAVVFTVVSIFVSQIVAQAKATEEERTARKAAEATNQAKDQLVSQVSHELRNPLATISMALDLWRSNTKNTEVAETAMKAIERALKLEFMFVNDLADWSRLRSGKFELSLKTARLNDIIESAWSVVKNLADSKSIRHVVTIEPQAEQVHCDEHRLTQVLWNFYTNAVKFTPHYGQIVTRAYADDSYVYVSVKDSGRGLTKPAIEHIFDHFWQTSQQDAILHGGLGLGLSIAREIVERHGGLIRAESDGLGKGSIFTVALKKDLA